MCLKKISFVVVACLLLAVAANAGTITFVGSETGGAGPAFRDTAVAKAYNTVAGEYYGSDGYIFWNAGGLQPSVNIGAAGTSIAGGLSGPVSLPSYITDIVTADANLLKFMNYVNDAYINNPTVAPADGLPLSLQTGGVCYSTGDTAMHDFFTITLGSIPAAGFRLGIMVDEYANTANSLSAMTLTYPGGTTSITGLTANGVPDLFFFDIVGLASGDTITVSASAKTSYPIISGLTLDAKVPEPSTLALLSMALLGLLCYAWRKRK